MASVTATNPKNGLSVKAYAGDNKTLLAFNFDNKQRAANLAGFSIQAQPPGKPAYFLINDLQFPAPNQHAVDKAEPPTSSANSPFQKYRWTHFTGQYHQGLNPAVGPYKYTVTPRYFDNNGNMLALDGTLSISVTIAVGPFKKGPLILGFTRGFMQSQAFEHHFGMHALLTPAGKALQRFQLICPRAGRPGRSPSARSGRPGQWFLPGRAGWSDPPRRPARRPPARCIASTVSRPTVGTSKRVSCRGLATFTTTKPPALHNWPARTIAWSVPSMASTASTAFSLTATLWPMSSRPISRANPSRRRCRPPHGRSGRGG